MEHSKELNPKPRKKTTKMGTAVVEAVAENVELPPAVKVTDEELEETRSLRADPAARPADLIHFRATINTEMSRAGMSQADLARKLHETIIGGGGIGSCRSQVSGFCKGKRLPWPSTLRALCKIFKRPPEYFVPSVKQDTGPEYVFERIKQPGHGKMVRLVVDMIVDDELSLEIEAALKLRNARLVLK
jgi:transcriptional regulator with XRE-family HTH domain